jgi:hypothetical protein
MATRKLKVNSHVTYFAVTTAKPLPATVTGFATDTNPILRLTHTGTTFGTASVGIAKWARTGSRAGTYSP